MLVVSEEMFDDPNTARTADYLDKQILKLGSEKLSQASLGISFAYRMSRNLCNRAAVLT